MSVLSQKTLKKEVKFEGIGLHTGKKALITILPSNPNTGIIFKRIDLKKNNIILPNVYNVSNATLCTTITNEYGVSVSTIEHLMGALYGLGIDNALIEINSQEVPILDGSAKIFVEKFLDVGFEISEVPIKLIKIVNEVSLKEGSKYISIGKSNVSLDIDFEIKYSNSLIGNQKNKINVYENKLLDIPSAHMVKMRFNKELVEKFTGPFLEGIVFTAFMLAFARMSPSHSANKFAEGLINYNVGRGANYYSVIKMKEIFEIEKDDNINLDAVSAASQYFEEVHHLQSEQFLFRQYLSQAQEESVQEQI